MNTLEQEIVIKIINMKENLESKYKTCNIVIFAEYKVN